MAYNFLSLVNDLNGRINEVPLTASDFVSASGWYHQAKEAVNAAVKEINQDVFAWPFNHATEELVLTPNQVRYPYPEDAKYVDFETFRIKGVQGVLRSQHLPLMDYEEYLSGSIDSEYNPQNHANRPTRVFRAPSLEFGVVPPPDQPYTLVYEYYRLPDPLVGPEDVPTVPQQFRHVIVDGATAYAFQFRGDPEAFMVFQQKFSEGIKTMRSLYVNRYEYVRSGFIPRQGGTGSRV